MSVAVKSGQSRGQGQELAFTAIHILPRRGLTLMPSLMRLPYCCHHYFDWNPDDDLYIAQTFSTAVFPILMGFIRPFYIFLGPQPSRRVARSNFFQRVPSMSGTFETVSAIRALWSYSCSNRPTSLRRVKYAADHGSYASFLEVWK